MAKSGRSIDELLEDIVLWGERTNRLIAGISYEQFIESELHQLAIAKCIEAIGEASGKIRRLYPDFSACHPDFAFEEAYRTRNRLSHGYDTIDWQVVWDTATRYVPELVARVRTYLSAIDDE